MVGEREGRRQAQSAANLLELFIGPLEGWLDDQLDRRLVRTFFLALVAMVRLRHNRSGLLLSELGAHILSPDKAPAGTKRLSNLLRSPKWSHTLLERFLWYRADLALESLQEAGEPALALWDESVLEKSESIALEGLGPVRSSKAARLKRIKPGYYNPPGGPPVFVPGLQWIAIMVAGYSGPPTLAAMRWWTRRGPWATDRFTNLSSLLDQCSEKWGQGVIHVWDRGFRRWSLAQGVDQPTIALRPALAHQLLAYRRPGQPPRLADLPRKAFRGPPDALGHQPPSVPQDGHRLPAGTPSPGGPVPVAGGISTRTRPQALVPADQRTPSLRWMMPGKWSSPMPAAGRWNCATEPARPTWPWKAHASGSGKTGSSCCSWSASSTPSCYPCWIPNVSYCCKNCCEAGATEPESGTATPRYRFPD